MMMLVVMTTTTPMIMMVLHKRDLHRVEFISLIITYHWTAYVVVHCL